MGRSSQWYTGAAGVYWRGHRLEAEHDWEFPPSTPRLGYQKALRLGSWYASHVYVTGNIK